MMRSEKTVRVGHVCLEVSDIEVAKRFYTPLFDYLRFKIVLDEKESIG